MNAFRIRSSAAALALLLLPYAVASAQPNNLLRVTRVVDGDTIEVEQIGRIRLIGVDCPEIFDLRKPVQRFGHESSEFLKQLIGGKRVWLDYDQERKDRYDRTLAYVHLPSGTFVNAEIVRQGYGFAYTRFPFKYLDEFRKLEREAREGGRGLWAPESSASLRPALDATLASSAKALLVYVTRTGQKYHAASCRHLARSRLPVALTDAVERYTPCSVCRPPSRPVGQ